MAGERSDAERQVADLLRTARSALGLDLASLIRMDGTTQYLQVGGIGAAVHLQRRHLPTPQTTFCQAVRDGRLPAVMPNDTVQRQCAGPHPDRHLSLPRHLSGSGPAATAPRAQPSGEAGGARCTTPVVAGTAAVFA